jgi:hypothetical protein
VCRDLNSTQSNPYIKIIYVGGKDAKANLGTFPSIARRTAPLEKHFGEDEIYVELRQLAEAGK